MRIPRDAFNKTKSDDSSPSKLDDELEEPPKVIITESVLTALRRCTCHLVTILVTITIITLALKGVYLGADLMSPVRSETINLMFLQLAAKAHEIMIVNSLGLIVLHFVRSELLFGDGLPLGLVGSGLTFNNFESFFKKEFYGTLKYVGDRGNKPRKVMFVMVVVVAGLTAALAGPASAVLLVPKSQDLAAGGTRFYLNGSEGDFWPADLSGDLSALRSLCNRNDSTLLGICPAGGFQSLWKHWGTVNSTNFRTHNVRSYANDLSGSNFYWPVSSPSSQVPPLYALGNSKNGDTDATTLIQPHVAAVVILQKLATDWWKALTSQRDISPDNVGDRIISANVRSGISVVRCANPRELLGADNAVKFPSINGRFNFAQSLPLAVHSLNNTAVNHLRFQWVHLSAQFGAASIGAVFETPWESKKASRVVVGCTAQAGWVPTTVFTNKYNFWTGWYPWNIQYADRTPEWSATSQASSNGRISLGDDWLNLLTPPTTSPDISSWRQSTIESILLNAGLGSFPNATTAGWLDRGSGSQAKVALVEAIICSVIVDGLSRTGSYRAFNTSGASSQWPLANYKLFPDFEKQILGNKLALKIPAVSPENLTTIEASMKISGFSFKGSLTSYLAMTVLLTHLIMATAHVIYVIRSRHTSRSWGSVAELIALSQTSQPAFDALGNTSSGIKSRKTFLQMAKIRVRKTPNLPNHKHHAHHEHVELLFESSVFPGHERNAPEHELDELHNEWLSHAATWPLNISELPTHTDLDDWSMLTSAERLVDSKEATDIVRPSQQYG
ncbi:hypothetical protein N7516_006008 [Penicillium verrucosum]|uniref:uncharacterized protein n=1 Tax=Penicillium verrucosum TaxID=60171 RepID=UPI002544F709|nr:uncharacterized protein N7516_006008 [Penicillium verrucosum]KAJ5931519.1 hypothetical protein N7516_006008 [Penicillium verrucosum]